MAVDSGGTECTAADAAGVTFGELAGAAGTGAVEAGIAAALAATIDETEQDDTTATFVPVFIHSCCLKALVAMRLASGRSMASNKSITSAESVLQHGL